MYTRKVILAILFVLVMLFGVYAINSYTAPSININLQNFTNVTADPNKKETTNQDNDTNNQGMFGNELDIKPAQYI